MIINALFASSVNRSNNSSVYVWRGWVGLVKAHHWDTNFKLLTFARGCRSRRPILWMTGHVGHGNGLIYSCSQGALTSVQPGREMVIEWQSGIVCVEGRRLFCIAAVIRCPAGQNSWPARELPLSVCGTGLYWSGVHVVSTVVCRLSVYSEGDLYTSCCAASVPYLSCWCCRRRAWPIPDQCMTLFKVTLWPRFIWVVIQELPLAFLSV